jgi:hypothetical protein
VREQLVVYLARVGRPVDARSFARNDALRVRLNEELAWASLIGDARRAHGGPIDPALIRRLEVADVSTFDRLALRGGAWLDVGEVDRAWADLSRVAEQGGDPSGAIAAAHLVGLEKLTIDPNGDVAFLRQLSAGTGRDALKAPQSPQRLVWIGDALAAGGDARRARKAYEAALDAAPETFDAAIGLAWLELAAGTFEWPTGPYPLYSPAARRMYEGFQRTGHPAYALALSDLLIAQGRSREAGELRALLPDAVEVPDPRVPALPRVNLPSGRAPLGPPPVR